MKFTNMAKIALTDKRSKQEQHRSFTNAWANEEGIYISEEVALITEAQCMGNKYTITAFSYNPDTNTGHITFIKEGE